MMFDIKGNKIVFSAEDLAIPPFKEFYNKAKDKEFARKQLEYIVWVYKWNSPYEAYPENERPQRVAQDVFGTNYEPDADVKELIKRFNEFQETPSTRLLGASRNAAEGLIQALNEYSTGEMDIDTAIKVTRILKDVGNIVKSLDIAMKQAKAEQLDSGKVKGGGVIGLYEMPKQSLND